MTTEDFLALVDDHKWVAIAALVVGLAVRLMKPDTKLPINIPAQYRVWIALLGGVVAGVLDKIASGGPWLASILGGLAAAAMAIIGHQTVIESLRGGKEIPLPGLMVDGPKAPPPFVGGAILGCALMLIGCGLTMAEIRKDLAMALDATQLACVFAAETTDSAIVAEVCAVDAALVPDLKKLLDAKAAGHRAIGLARERGFR